MIELRAVLTCDRCGVEVVMANVDDMNEVNQRLAQSEWCDSDGGELVCPECWERWDAKQLESPPPRP